MKKYIQELKRVRAGSYRKPGGGLFLDRNERVVPLIKTFRKLCQRNLAKCLSVNILK